MLLIVCFSPPPHIIERILNEIENNSVLVGVITSVIIGSLWFRKYIMQKRAEAFFGFYARLSLRLKSLQTRLEENGQLNTSDKDAGNIYSLIYVENYIESACPGYNQPDEKELKAYAVAAAELKKLILETDNNVYPPRANRKKWYESQHTIFAFCEFLEKKEYRHTTNQKCANGENEPKHTVKCKALIEAMNYIQESIDRAKY